ncbi:LamG domain-containing protein [Mucilaginibacter sp.]|uniref:LamG domain-containing protein n=1 Tax=Mucilaginibacter sp. TaxID=1882438 RepID=UPI0025E8BBE1|nr:LamG domain-containing protein [Mucilaginibacter sp.]
MSRFKKSSAAFMVMIALISIFQSCTKSADKPNYNSDKTKLGLAIDSATLLYTATVEGSKPGQYAVGARTDLKTAIDLATGVKTGTFTQQQVNNAQANLNRVLTQFKSRLIQEVSAANLIAQWKFDGNANDATTNGHNGMLKTGIIGPGNAPVDGNTLPKLIADRFGRTDKAFDFNNGAYIEVPYDITLNPKEFTISIWIKRHSTYSDNYIMSLNRWNGFKFQLQSNNFLFMTFHADNGYHDVDDNPGAVPLEVWTHASVSYTNGTMKFYVNGALVKTAAVTGAPLTLANPVNLTIGQQLPKSLITTDQSSDYAYYGGSFFNGSMDDLRFYNRALTDAEVLSIYTIESTL